MSILALPGLGLDGEAWAPTLDALAQRSSVLRLPGYGEPAATSTDLRPRALAERVLAGLPVDVPMVLLGHSASCQLAAHVALLAPDRISRLVLVGPTTDPRSATWPRLVRRWLLTARHETPRQVPALVRQYRRTTLRTMARAMEAARRDDIVDALARAGAPALVVRGHHDRICPADWAASVASGAGPGSRAVTVPAGGHMVPLTHGRLVADAIGTSLGPDG